MNTELTRREVEVLELIADGFTDKQISKSLFIEVSTVATHRKHIYDKICPPPGTHPRIFAAIYFEKHYT